VTLYGLESNNMNLKSLSRAITTALRHKPEMYRLTLDKEGYAPVEAVIKATGCTLKDLERIIADSDKKRLALNEDKTLIKATNGHSVKNVEAKTVRVEPKQPLFHGTAVQNVESILKQGLLKMGREAVHMSDNSTDAIAVGRRNGMEVLFEINAMAMIADGLIIRKTENGVYYTDHVPPKYLKRVR
jgi:putative RNA 2'-phosphotransferase